MDEGAPAEMPMIAALPMPSASSSAACASACAAGEASAGVVADAWYQLAAIHDGAGRFAAACEALQRAKKIFAGAAGPTRYDAADIAEVSRRTYASVTADHFDRWAAQGAAFRPLGRGLALLVSHPRSGTTLLEQAHVNLVPGSAFGAEGFVRMSFATGRETIDAGLNKLAEWLAGGK